MIKGVRFPARLGLILAGAFLVCFVFVPKVSALYVWQDETGVTHITEYPDPRNTEKVTEQLKYRASKPVAPAPQTPPEEEVRTPAPPRPELRFARPDTGGVGASEGEPSLNPPETTVPIPNPEELEKALGKLPLTAEEQRELQEAFKRMPAMPPGFPGGDDQAAAGFLALIMAFLGGFLLLFVFLGIAMYLFFSLCLFLIAKKLDVENPWIAWIPLVQSWTFVQCAGKPWWWLLMLWLGTLIFAPVGMIVGIVLWVSITENLGQNKWLGLLTLVPLVNLFFIGYLAFAKSVVPGGGTVVESGLGFTDEAPPEEPRYPDLPPEEDYEEPEPPPLPK